MDNSYHKTAMRFVLLLGAVSLFADMTYEAVRSVWRGITLLIKILKRKA